MRGHRQENWESSRRAWLVTYLLGEGLQLVLGVHILPDALHVIPVSHHAMLHGVADGQQPPMLLQEKGGPSLYSCFLSPHALSGT